jgi:hypothetical protein
MSRIPSTSILAKDVIGQAVELAGVEEVRQLLRSIGITYYNYAINELHNILSIIEPDSLLATANLTPSSTSQTEKFTNLPFSTINYDQIKNLLVKEASGTSNFYEAEYLPFEQFARHKNNKGAMYPFNYGFVYTVTNTGILMVMGEALSIEMNAIVPTLIYKIQPVLLTPATYSSAYMFAPDKYLPVLANRITSYAEIRKGISENAMVMVKKSYEEMLATVESQSRAKILGSFIGFQEK